MIRSFAVIGLAALAACGAPEPDPGAASRQMDLPADTRTICGVAGLLGAELGDVNGGASGGCGIDDPVRIYAVGGIRVQGQPRVNCDTALALKDWVDNGAQPAARKEGVRITGLNVVASYACRRRNNLPNGKLSEHAKGNALDIASFRLSDGHEVSVLKDWGSGKYSGLMRNLHASACGPFGTVLGPRSDRFHRDHFHFDVASHGNGPYCR